MKYIGISDAGRARIEFAVAIMREVTPDWHSWFVRVIHTIVVDREACGSPLTIACTWTQKYGPGAIVFPDDPKVTPAAKLAQTLRHEVHHYDLGWGGLLLKPHTCSDPWCQEPSERACDPIYKADAIFGPRYDARYQLVMEAVLKQEAAKRAASAPPLSFEDVMKGAGIAAAWLFGIGLLFKVAAYPR